MRTIELIVMLAVLPPVLSFLTPRREPRSWIPLLSFLALMAAVVHLREEGYRWQMLPAYVLVAMLVLYEATRWIHLGRRSLSFGVVAFICWLAALGLTAVLPVFEFPKPTGPFRVGTEVRHLVDPNRRESFSSNASDPRELMAQIWYPVDPSFQGHLAAYREKQATSWGTAQLALVKTHAYLGAPMAPAQANYPILVFSPSWSGQRVQNTFQTEELASHGYIVVAIDHPYGTDVTVFPDGRIVRTKLGSGENYSSQQAFEQFVREADQQIEIRAQDARFVLDKLTEFNHRDPEGLLTGRLDLQRVGIFGHSLGGSVAAQACWLDVRFSAALDMDGMLGNESAGGGSPRPLFFMMEDETLPPRTQLPSLSPQQRRAAEFGYRQAAMMKTSLTRSGGYRMVILGTTHRNYSDSPFFSPLKFLTGAGAISTDRAVQIINQYTLAFFDKTLKGQSQPLLAGLSPDFPEARLEVWTAQSQFDPKASALGPGAPFAVAIPRPAESLQQ